MGDAVPYPIPDPEEKMICPYDPSHSIAAKKMQYHLIRCRRQHVGQEYTQCPFNAKHEMPKVELRYHISVCADKPRIAADIEYEKNKNNPRANEFKGCTDVPSYEYDFKMPKCSEDWDSEILQNPRIGINRSTLMNPNIFGSTLGMTKAEKKQYTQFLYKIQANGGEVPEEPPQQKPQRQVQQIERVRAPQTTLTHGLLRAGVGRGAAAQGMGGGDGPRRPGTTTAMIMALARGRPLNHSASSGAIPKYSGAAAASSTDSQEDESGAENGQTVDLKKKEKKIQKKLRQIQILEDKQDRGEELTPDEFEKLSKREELEKALEFLNLD